MSDYLKEQNKGIRDTFLQNLIVATLMFILIIGFLASMFLGEGLPKTDMQALVVLMLAFATACFEKVGLDHEHAATISRLLVNSDLRGVRSPPAVVS